MKLMVSLVSGTLLFLLSQSLFAQDAATHKRQMTLLYSMTERASRAQKVYIYDGFRDRDIDRFLDDQFRNMQNVMFTNVIVTDKQGRPVRDPHTGLLMREDDGC